MKLSLYLFTALASLLIGCQAGQPVDSTEAETVAEGAILLKAPFRVPSIGIPAGQPLVPRTHLGDLMGQQWYYDPNTVHIMAGDDVVASSTDFWTLEVGTFQDGGWSHIVTVTTKPLAVGGLGDLYGGFWYELPNGKDAFGWRTTIAVKAKPTGSPTSPSWLVAFPAASIVP
jgi:hypothetical protein